MALFTAWWVYLPPLELVLQTEIGERRAVCEAARP